MLIDDYIKAATTMKNTSQGEAGAYHFDDVVLVKYQKPIKYGIARQNEEEVARIANEKNAKGVRTPAHLAIKRETAAESNICWVLQQRAKGDIFTDYCMNKNCDIQIYKQRVLATAPDSHFEQAVSDLMELYNLGLEMKSKNVFYDVSKEDGGFTFIDLGGLKGNPFDCNNLNDVIRLQEYFAFVYNGTMISFPYSQDATEEQRKISNNLYYQIRLKVFLAMRKVVPTFSLYERWILRTLPRDVLEYFAENGIDFSNLSLTEEEITTFSNIGNAIIDESLAMASQGKSLVDVTNYISRELQNGAMGTSWHYHKDNNLKREDFKGRFADLDFMHANEDSLKEYIGAAFYEKLKSIAVTNEKLQKFLDAYEAEVAKNRGWR